MKRVLIVILCSLLLISTSCNSKSAERTNTSNRTIFYIHKGYEEEATTDEGKFPDLVDLNFDNEKQEVAFIKTYLQERGISKEVPDGMTCYNGKNVVEYYMDQEKRKICFVFRLLNPIAFDACYFVTLNLDDMTKVGNLTYRLDEKKDTAYESLYDTNGEQMAHLTYQYFPSIPFPLIVEYEDMDSYKESIGDVLYRSQKFWLYDKMAKFDEYGKLTTYDNDFYEPDNINSQSVFLYDKLGRLEKIEGTLSQSNLEKYFSEEAIAEFNCADISEIKLSYQEKGMIDKVEYQRSHQVYGTTGQGGGVYYDEQGRMVYESSYITHGSTYNFYLYHEDERTPWACICIDSMPYSRSVKDGYEYCYGNSYSIYLFQSS